MHPPENTPDPQTVAALHALKRIQSAINAAPLMDLAEIVIKDLELDFVPAVGRMKADEAIQDLADMAHLGDVTALQHLVVLGCKIARILEGLIGNPENGEGGKSEKPKPLPVDKIAQDAEISKFADDVDVLAGSDEKVLEAILKRLVSRDPTDRFSIGLDELSDSIPPPAGLTQDSAKPIPGNKRLVEMICQSLVNRRLTKESRAAARRVAAESWGWPIEVSAIADKRIETISQHLDFLALGSKIPANLDTRDGRGTAKTSSKRDFSIFFFEKLNAERMIPRSSRHKEELLEDENGASAETDCQIPSNDKMRITTWHIENYWKRKAALLPEFTRDAESQRKWHEAAIAYADSMCMGDFEKHKWPDFIIDRTRVNTKNPHPRSTKSAVTEVLNSGLLALAKKRKP
jgi:hypothetical protein